MSEKIDFLSRFFVDTIKLKYRIYVTVQNLISALYILFRGCEETEIFINNHSRNHSAIYDAL